MYVKYIHVLCTYITMYMMLHDYILCIQLVQYMHKFIPVHALGNTIKDGNILSQRFWSAFRAVLNV